MIVESDAARWLHVLLEGLYRGLYRVKTIVALYHCISASLSGARGGKLEHWTETNGSVRILELPCCSLFLDVRNTTQSLPSTLYES